MKTIQRSIEVQAPVSETFEEWSHFEDFPQFMSGLDEMHSVDERHVHWKAHFNGHTEEGDAEITEMIPNRIISWRTTHGVENSGQVHFEPSGRGGTRLDVRIDYEPHSWIARITSAMGAVDRRIDHDLRKFKDLVEHHQGTQSSGMKSEEKPRMHGSEMNEGPGM